MGAFVDPRSKFLGRLGQNGLLSGDEARQNRARDLREYPDIVALAQVAKTRETFCEIISSPQVSPLPDKPALSSPGSTSAGSSLKTTPINLAALPDLDLSDAEEEDDAETFSRSVSGPSEFDGYPVRDQDRANFLWNIAQSGPAELKPLAKQEMETDGSMKTGVYLLASPKAGPIDAPARVYQGIFKPLDEEAFERRGIELGLGAVREEAAFLIDRCTGGQANCPTTTRASIEEGGIRKRGSIQQFVEGAIGPVEDFGMPSEIEAAKAIITVDDAQAIACFDIRMFNADRHPGNLLVAGPRPHKVISIDHGCILPAWWALESARFEAWLEWPHLKAPPTAATLELIEKASNSISQVSPQLDSMGIPKQAVWTFEICTMLLQKCIIHHGLTLRKVALLMTRLDPAKPCWLEDTIKDACLAAGFAASFEPEGKYGDLMLQVDGKLKNAFSAAAGDVLNQKLLTNFRTTFFNFLQNAFEHSDTKHAAQAAEDLAEYP